MAAHTSRNRRVTIGTFVTDGREQGLCQWQRCRASGEAVVWIREAWRHGPGYLAYTQVCACGRSWGGAPTLGRPEGGT